MAGNDPNWANVKLLMNFNGANDAYDYVDWRGYATWTRYGSNAMKTAQKKFGASSVYFSGSASDYFRTHASYSSTNFCLGTSDFTIDFWMRPSSTAYAYPTPIQKVSGSWSADNWSFSVDHTSAANKYTLWCYNVNSSAPAITSSSNVTYDTWQHVAICRSGSNFYLFIDGVLEGSCSSSAAFNNATVAEALTIGYGFLGYIDDLRITKNVCRWTSGFTPPDYQAMPYARYVAGSFTEVTDHTDFVVRTHRADTGAFLNELAVTGATYECPCCPTATYTDYANPVFVSAFQKIGAAWVANTAYAQDAYVFPTDPVTTPYVYKCTTAGTSHSTTEPTWGTTPGGTTTDGDVTWTCVGRMVQPILHGPLIPSV